MLGGPETVISLADGPCAAVSLHFLAPTVSTAASTAARYCAKQYQNVIQTVISKGLLNEYELKSLVVLMVLRGPFESCFAFTPHVPKDFERQCLFRAGSAATINLAVVLRLQPLALARTCSSRSLGRWNGLGTVLAQTPSGAILARRGLVWTTTGRLGRFSRENENSA